MKSQPLLVTVFAAALAFLSAGCDEHASIGVRIASGPTRAALGEMATFVVKLTYDGFFYSPTSRIRMEWGDTLTEISDPVAAGDSVLFKHAWLKSGTYQVTAVALAYPQPRSSPWTIRVSSPSDPVVDSAQFYSEWRPTELVAFAHHPSGESLRLAVAWGDNKAETTGFQASPCRFRATHAYTGHGDMQVVLRTLSQSGAVSAPETLSAYVTTDGEVTGLWQCAYSGSSAIAGGIVYLVGPTGFCGLRDSAAPYVYAGSFIGHPSFSIQTEHIYIGSEDGQLHAFTSTLKPAWVYPESVTGWRWGPAAVKGNVLYAPCSNDSVYCLVDNGTSVTREAAFSAAGADAVAIDAAGNVYVGGDSGCLFKLTAGLNLVWRASLQTGGAVFAPVLGADGTVYCTSDPDRVFALQPADGSVKWSATLGGVCYHPVIGPDGLYAGAVAGVLSKLDLSTGASIWVRNVGNHRLDAAPVVVVDGYVYVQSDDGRPYCVRQSNGDSVWVCNPADYNPQPRGRAMPLGDGTSSPAVDSLGRVYVVGSGMLSKLNTWTPLDVSAPWPKWQHDLYNTGNVGGGR